MTSFNLQHRTSQSNVRNVNVTEVFNLVFILISTWNIFVLFGIIKYLSAGYEGDSKLTFSLDVNYDPPLRVRL